MLFRSRHAILLTPCGSTRAMPVVRTRLIAISAMASLDELNEAWCSKIGQPISLVVVKFYRKNNAGDPLNEIEEVL